MGGGASGSSNNSPTKCTTPPREYPPSPPRSSSVVVEEEPSSSSSGGRRLSDSPILLLVLIHKATRGELTQLQRIVVNAGEKGVWDRELVVDLRRRFDFLKRVYISHCDAEDEVIFLALDHHVKNVTCTYSLEHKSIDDLFDSIFRCLNILSEDHETSEEFQELIFCVGTLHKIIDKHMHKEEKQVFPLLIRQFSDTEQGSLVWQYIHVVPVTLLEEMFPWLKKYISGKELEDLKCCLIKVVSSDDSLQKVFVSWLESNTPNSSIACLRNAFISRKRHQQQKENNTQENGCLVDGFQIWHGAIMFDLKELFEQLREIRSKNKVSNMTSVVTRIKFLVDVLLFYSNTLDKIFYPLFEEFSILQPTLLSYTCHFRSEVEALQNILYNDSQDNLVLISSVEKLRVKLESLMILISEHSSHQEAEVFPIINKILSHETQQRLMFSFLHMMPLGLLKCVISRFSSYLPKDKWRSVLHHIEQGGFIANTFAYLLHEWVRTSYSGKTSMEEWPELFKNRRLSISKSKQSTELLNHLDPISVKACFANNDDPCAFESTSPFHVSENSGIPQNTSGNSADNGPVLSLEPKPLDLIYYFHKAMKKDLEYLVLSSSKLAGNFGLVIEFQRRFQRMRTLYQMHTDAEDEIAFPALEAQRSVQNISQAYSIDHKVDAECFERISRILDKICKLKRTDSSSDSVILKMKYRQLCLKLQDSCRSLQKILGDHVHHEEIEVWPKFKECFSNAEQEKIVGCMLGRLGSEILQEMIPWLSSFLMPEEQLALMSSWRKATKNTKFDEWLSEWWEVPDGSGTVKVMNKCDTAKVTEESTNYISRMAENLQILAKYMSLEDSSVGGEVSHDECEKILDSGSDVSDSNNHKGLDADGQKYEYSEFAKLSSEKENKQVDKAETNLVSSQVTLKFCHKKKLLSMGQQEMEAVIRKVSSDSSLDLQMKSQIIQNLLMRPWIDAQEQPNLENISLPSAGELLGQFPTYRDQERSIFGCKHYKQNCKLVASCCNQLFTCRHCHDDVVSDHQMNGRATTQMMCMKCLTIQPIGQVCSTESCNGFLMARYYCRICKLFDDERHIYHCPYCNLCRVGKGLGIDFFHCMKCNACMARSLSVHLCREKCFEDKCPICHEDIFTSTTPIKALPCSHLMHSDCFQEYTRMHYVCPICSKSLGDMQVYFSMLDALLAEETLPEEYQGRTQAILCNDCEKKGVAPFHWFYHKCPFCRSYNTRPL